MPRPSLRNERIGALFLFAVLLFNSPLLDIFDAGPDVAVAGIPLLYFYIFFAWGGIILLVALVVGSPWRGGDKHPAVNNISEEE